MNFHTILYRELSMAARRPSTYFVRVIMASIAGVISLVVTVATVRGFIAPEETGRTLLAALAVVGLIWVLFEGLLLTVDSISSERREGTLGLLFLSNLTGRDIVAGKMGAAGTRTLFALMASSTAPALTFIFGGVTFAQYGQVILALLNALFFALCLGVLLSCVSSERRMAQARAVALFLWTLVLSPALAVYLYHHHAIAAALIFAPGPVAPFLVIAAEDPNLSGAFSASFAISNFLAWTMFVFASRKLSQNWRETQPSSSPARRDEEALISSRTTAARTLGNPVLWLQDRRSPGFPKFRAICGLAICAGILCFFFAPGKYLPGILGSFLLVMHLALSFEVASVAARALAEDRRSGLLELLLTTPLREEDIAAGHLLAIKGATVKALLLLLAFGILWISFVWHYADAGQFTGFLLVYGILFFAHLSELWFNCRVGLWKGLTLGNPHRAYRSTTAAILLISGLSAGAALLVMGSVVNVLSREYLGLIAGLGGVIAVPATMSAWFAIATSNLTDKMREVAATPVGLNPSSAP